MEPTIDPNVRLLPVVLSEEEIKQRATRLVDRLTRKEDVSAERQRAVALAYRELKELNAEIHALTEIVASGREIREVQCCERRDLDRRVLEVVRLDTGEVVDSRQLQLAEMQGDLPFVREQGERHTSYASVVDFPVEESLDAPEPPGPRRRRRSPVTE